MRPIRILFAVLLAAGLRAGATQRVYLSGTDKDHTVAWDFFCTKGQHSGVWTQIPVPSCWELQGFGAYGYGWWGQNLPDEVGRYRTRFQAPAAWAGKRAFLVFEGAMTDTEVKLNGAPTGPRHEGGYIAFRDEVTDKLKLGQENLLEAEVSKVSADPSINLAEKQADYWNYGGIYRPVYLELQPPSFVRRVAIDARADGAFQLDAFPDGARAGDQVQVTVCGLDGKTLGAPLRGSLAPDGAPLRLKGRFAGVQAWNAEQPKLYLAKVRLSRAGRELHSLEQRFGFRTFELRPHDGLYVNGRRVILKGACRHSVWPETGRTLSESVHRLDIERMHEMNMNAVRMSHYPPDERFLELCDELGLYVLDEIAGWQKAYGDAPARRAVTAMVERDVNHPSILFWDNGNEGGFNASVEPLYHELDPQARPVLNPWLRHNGVDTKHYPDYAYVAESALRDPDILMPTEFMHSLFDEGGGAGLKDFWDAMLQHPHLGGGFIWALLDEGIVRTDQGGRIDVAGNAAPDGLLGPHREKEGSYYTVREVWSPIQAGAPVLEDGGRARVLLENRYDFSSLAGCRFDWRLLALPGPAAASGSARVLASGRLRGPGLLPGERGWLGWTLPASRGRADVLAFSATDAHGREVAEWTWPLKSPAEQALPSWPAGAAVQAVEDKAGLAVLCDGLRWRFDKKTGQLQGVDRGAAGTLPLQGPGKAGRALTLTALKHGAEPGGYVVEPQYNPADKFKVRWTFQPGQPVRLDYSYGVEGANPNLGVGFKFPPEAVTGMTWRGRGPQRVYRNRLQGPQLGVWHKAANDTITGLDWNYPEFRGYHSELYWVTVEAKGGPFTVYAGEAGTFLQMLRPTPPPYGGNLPSYADADLAFLQAISPVGTKFQKAEVMGPSGQPNRELSWAWPACSLRFDLR